MLKEKIFLLQRILQSTISFHQSLSSRFSSSCHRDYAPNDLLDRYSDAGIDDDEDIDELTPEARRAAERKMTRRDQQERTGKRGSRAARRSRMPAFLGSDGDLDDDEMDDGLGISRMKRRTRRQYDERRDLDDLDGIEDVSQSWPSNKLLSYHLRLIPCSGTST